MPGNRKRSDQGPRQSGRREAGLRGGAVLVDDPTEHVVASNVAERRGSRDHFVDRCRHFEPKAAMRPMLVVMPDVVAKDGFEMMTAENERPVEALFSYGPYPPVRDRVRTRRSDGRLDHLYAFGGEHLVEAGGELRVAVSDQEPGRPTVLGEISCEVAGNLGDEGPGRMIGDTEDVVKGTNTWIGPLSWRSSVSSDIIGRCLDPLALCCVGLVRVLGFLQSRQRSEHDKDVELTVLRAVRVLERQPHACLRYRRSLGFGSCRCHGITFPRSWNPCIQCSSFRRGGLRPSLRPGSAAESAP